MIAKWLKELSVTFGKIIRNMTNDAGEPSSISFYMTSFPQKLSLQMIVRKRKEDENDGIDIVSALAGVR